MSQFPSILTEEQLQYILHQDEVVTARENLAQSNVVKFTIALPLSIKNSIKSIGLDLTSTTNVYLRWIKGDTPAHIDRGATSFSNTYLIYLTDSTGTLNVGEETFSISKGSAFVFPEGIAHSFTGAGDTARLMIGPLNEFGAPVGSSVGITYYETESGPSYNWPDYDLLDEYGVYDISGNAFVFTGTLIGWHVFMSFPYGSSPIGDYPIGATLIPTDGATYFVTPIYQAVCLLEGTNILCLEKGEEKEVPIEKIRKGDLVKTPTGCKPVECIGYSKIYNPSSATRGKNRLYQLDNLVLTGCHSLLVPSLTEKERADAIEQFGKIYVTDKYYRLPACINSKCSIYPRAGLFTIWHLALENSDKRMNYGMYANGILVETCSIRMMKHYSGLTLV